MNEKKDIELEVFKKSGSAEYSDVKAFDDDIEFINFDKKSTSFTERIKNITKISNKDLLLVTTLFFAAFVVCEVIGGLAAHSLSLLGDAGAMTIDVCSYGFNFFAEYMKSSDSGTKAKSSMLHDCAIEVFIPGISVMALLGVTGWVCSDAVLRLLGHKDEDVDVAFLYYFAGANLLVDIVCTWLFYLRRQDVFLQPSKEKAHEEDEAIEQSAYDMDDVEIVFAEYSESDKSLVQGGKEGQTQLKAKNLNMISAFTHVGGDTLRSFTVLVAAVISSSFSIDASITDAIAAIVVSFTIVVAVMPLVYSLGVSILDYKKKFAGQKASKSYTGLNTESDDSTHHGQGNEVAVVNRNSDHDIKLTLHQNVQPFSSDSSVASSELADDEEEDAVVL